MTEKSLLTEVASNLAIVERRIAQAAQEAGRKAEAITLIAVSKTKPISAIAAAYKAGQRDFGENRLEELGEKVKQAADLGLSEIRWHLIGTIQSRKTKQAVGPFALIHALDRAKIAEHLSRDAEAAQCVLSVLLEVNVSGEASKHGFTPDELRRSARQLNALPGLNIRGLMTMAPFVADSTVIRPVFHGLRSLRDELNAQYPQLGWQELSMGMTNDFELAIAEGATLVRIGSAIFGERTTNA